MKKNKILLRSIDGIGFVCHMPFIPLFTKLIEEIIDSKEQLLLKAGRIIDHDKGRTLAPLTAGRIAIENYFNEEFPEALRKKQLLIAWSHYHKAYHVLRLRHIYSKHCARTAKSLAICHFFLGDRQQAREWVEVAIRDNSLYHCQEDQSELLDLREMLKEQHYLPKSEV
jgi:hypothetical protein